MSSFVLPTLVTILPDRPPGGGGPTNISLCFNFSENAQEMMDALRDKSNDEVKTLLGRHVVQEHDKCNRIKESFGKYLHKGLMFLLKIKEPFIF